MVIPAYAGIEEAAPVRSPPKRSRIGSNPPLRNGAKQFNSNAIAPAIETSQIIWHRPGLQLGGYAFSKGDGTE